MKVVLMSNVKVPLHYMPYATVGFGLETRTIRCRYWYMLARLAKKELADGDATGEVPAMTELSRTLDFVKVTAVTAWIALVILSVMSADVTIACSLRHMQNDPLPESDHWKFV